MIKDTVYHAVRFRASLLTHVLSLIEHMVASDFKAYSYATIAFAIAIATLLFL